MREEGGKGCTMKERADRTRMGDTYEVLRVERERGTKEREKGGGRGRERERERQTDRERKRDREREKEREIYPRLPASQSASPGQHRPGIVASALASLLSRTINLASIPDRPFSVSPFVLVCACVPGLRVYARVYTRVYTRIRHGHAVL